MSYLAYGGVLVYIIPHYALDEEIRAYLVRNFQNLRVFMAPERQFKQCVIVGTRCKPAYVPKSAQQFLIDAQASEEGAAIIPEVWTDAPYVVPAVQTDQTSIFMQCVLMKRSCVTSWSSSSMHPCGEACRGISVNREVIAGRRCGI